MSTYDYLIQAGEKKGEKKEKILATKGLLKEGMINEFICRVLREPLMNSWISCEMKWMQATNSSPRRQFAFKNTFPT